MKKNKINSGLVIFILVLIGVYFLKIKKDEIDKKIILNHYETVGYVINFSKNKSPRKVSFRYSINGRQYKSWEICEYQGSNYLNKYYKLYVSKDNPKQNILFLDNQITDPVKI
jgi:hypothetical protein